MVKRFHLQPPAITAVHLFSLVLTFAEELTENGREERGKEAGDEAPGQIQSEMAEVKKEVKEEEDEKEDEEAIKAILLVVTTSW